MQCHSDPGESLPGEDATDRSALFSRRRRDGDSVLLSRHEPADDNARFQRRLSEALHQRRQQSQDGCPLQETPTQQDLSFETMRENLPIGSVTRD